MCDTLIYEEVIVPMANVAHSVVAVISILEDGVRGWRLDIRTNIIQSWLFRGYSDSITPVYEVQL